MAAAYNTASPEIIIIDDDFFVRDFAVHTIEFGADRKTVTFENGLTAWQYLQKRPDFVDVIIADANLPEINGLELLDRTKHHFPAKSFIITSSNPEHEKTARQMGADAFLSKPFDVDDLFAIIEQFVLPTSAESAH